MKSRPRKLRLTFVICAAFPTETGGRETWLWNIVKRIHKDYHITIICKRNPLSHSLYDIPSDVTLVTVPVLSSIPRLGKILMRSYLPVFDAFLFSINVFIYFLFRRAQIDETYIAMGTLYEATPLRWWTRIKKGYIYVCAVRGKMADDSGNSHPLLRTTFKNMEYINLLHASQIWSNGADTSSYLQKLGFGPLLMKNGVDYYEFHKPENQYVCPGFIDNSLTNITMVATLRGIRGLDTAIRACVYLGQRTKSFRMIFVGKGAQARWKKLATELNTSEHIIFAGERTDIANILHFSDIVLAFCDERYGSGLSMSLLEAMASGKPIVAWENAIYTQLLVNHENSLLVPENEPKALANAILELIESPDLRERIGSNARKTAADYDWSEVVSDFKKYVELHKRCFTKRSYQS